MAKVAVNISYLESDQVLRRHRFQKKIRFRLSR